jgi:1-aminocyclopropane-1-carboxylate synthase
MGVQIEQLAAILQLSTIAVSDTHGEDSPYFAGWKAYDEDPYDEVKKHSGVVQMGMAENQVKIGSI